MPTDKNNQSENKKENIFVRLIAQLHKFWRVFNVFTEEIDNWLQSVEDEYTRTIIAERLPDEVMKLNRKFHELELYDMVKEAEYILQYEDRKLLSERLISEYESICELIQTLEDRAEELFEENPYKNPEWGLQNYDRLSEENYFKYNYKKGPLEQGGPFAYTSGISYHLSSMEDLLTNLSDKIGPKHQSLEQSQEEVTHPQEEALLSKQRSAHGETSEMVIVDDEKTPTEKDPNNESLENSELENAFRKVGDKWEVIFNKVKMGYFDNIKGMGQIAQLLSKPNETIPAIQLFNSQYDSELLKKGKNIDSGNVMTEGNKPQELVDKTALNDCNNKLKEIEVELQEAEENADMAKKEALEADKKDILSYLRPATKPSNDICSFSDNIQKARIAVTNSINRALKKIENCNTDLYQHLHNAIKRGTHFTYRPDKKTNWEL